MIVMKFGGSSVATRNRIEKVLGIVRSRAARTPLVVSSAHKGITDGLIDAARSAASGTDPDHRVIERQREIAASLGCPAELLEPVFDELADLLRGIRLVRELSPRSLDYISSFGERMSVRCIADFFAREGLPARAFDAWELGFISDTKFGKARPLPEFPSAARQAYREHVSPGTIPIVTGFVARTATGEITTVGRNGSDLTASLFGAALAAEEVEIWSDTDGVMTADPGLVPTAKTIPQMGFDEAAELAFFGSRMLHPATLIPAIENDIAVRVLNTNRPDHPGTVISASPPPKDQPFTSIAYKKNQVVLTITEPRMFEQIGFLAKVFTVLAGHHVVVDMVATSEVSVSVTSHDALALEAAVPDLQRFGRVDVRPDKAILAVVGRFIHSTPGLGARVMNAIAKAGVNIEMHSFGVRSNNISLLIADTQIKDAVPALHRALFED